MHPDDKRMLDVIAEGLAKLYDYEEFTNLPIGLTGLGALAVWEAMEAAGVEFRFKAPATHSDGQEEGS